MVFMVSTPLSGLFGGPGPAPPVIGDGEEVVLCTRRDNSVCGDRIYAYCAEQSVVPFIDAPPLRLVGGSQPSSTTAPPAYLQVALPTRTGSSV